MNEEKKSSYWRWLLAFGLGFICLLTLAFQIETVHLLEGWRWNFSIKKQFSWIFAAGSVMLSFGFAFFALRLKGALKMLMLVCLGLTSQYGPALSTLEGLPAIEDRALSTGHREFGVIASRDLEMSLVLSDYESLASAPSQRFSRSKPPGHLLGYMLLHRLAVFCVPAQASENPKVIDDAHWQLVRFMALFLPLLAGVTLIPLWHLARRWLDKERSTWACIFFAVTPSFALVQMHFDQAVYPLLCILLWLNSTQVNSDNGLKSGFLIGLLSYLCVFVSFSLLPALALVPLLMWSTSIKANWMQLGMGLFLGFGGVLICGMTLGYFPLVRYEQALIHHAEWKNWIWDPWLVFQFSVLNLVEFVWWLGLGLSVLLLSGIHIYKNISTAQKRLVISLSVIILMILSFGKTIGEVGRLWIFLMPLFIICGCSTLNKKYRARVFWVILLQLITITLFRYAQDFW